MIYLNKADEASLRHLAWNQSPPALAPASTTRQDLNGIANLRQFVAAAVAGSGASAAELGAARRDVHRPWPVAAAPDAGRQSVLHGEPRPPGCPGVLLTRRSPQVCPRVSPGPPAAMAAPAAPGAPRPGAGPRGRCRCSSPPTCSHR